MKIKKPLPKYEKKIRIRTAKRVKRAVKNRIPQSSIGSKILTAILFIEKILQKT